MCLKNPNVQISLEQTSKTSTSQCNVLIFPVIHYSVWKKNLPKDVYYEWIKQPCWSCDRDFSEIKKNLSHLDRLRRDENFVLIGRDNLNYWRRTTDRRTMTGYPISLARLRASKEKTECWLGFAWQQVIFINHSNVVSYKYRTYSSYEHKQSHKLNI